VLNFPARALEWAAMPSISNFILKLYGHKDSYYAEIIPEVKV
jgi:hypothetical protein